MKGTCPVTHDSRTCKAGIAGSSRPRTPTALLKKRTPILESVTSFENNPEKDKCNQAFGRSLMDMFGP